MMGAGAVIYATGRTRITELGGFDGVAEAWDKYHQGGDWGINGYARNIADKILFYGI